MKTTMRKTLPALLCSASLLAVAGLCGPAAAQDAPDAAPAKVAPTKVTAPAASDAVPATADSAPAPDGMPAADDGSAEDAKSADQSEADKLEEKRKLLEVDPSVVDAVKAFDRNSLIVTREKIGTDTMIINQDIDRAQAIGKLIKLYGVSAFAAAYPDIYAQIKDSPMVLDAKIEMQKSKNDLEDALNPDKGKKDATPAADVKQPRNDGSQFFAMPQASEQPPTAAPKQVAPKAEEATPAPADTVKAEAPVPEKPEVKPISLREIYGIGDHLRAVITYGNERTDVVEGDTLPDETKIKSVREKAIDIERDGDVTTLRITG